MDDLANTIGVLVAGFGCILGFVGLLMNFADGRDWLDNGQRGFFVGAFLGSIGAFFLHLCQAASP